MKHTISREPLTVNREPLTVDRGPNRRRGTEDGERTTENGGRRTVDGGRIGLLGRKLEMTQLFNEKGDILPVTVVEAGPCYIIQKKSVDKDSYNAIQIGFEPQKRYNKPKEGHFKKNNLPVLRYLKEIRVGNPDNYSVGQELKVDIFAPGDTVSVTSKTKGRGFQGGMKRWGWHGGPASHGSMSHRRIGALSSNTFPGRPWKGRTLPGHYGNETVTVKNLKVVKIESEKNLIYISGSIPGMKKSLVLISK